MLRNYLQLVFRNMAKHKLTSMVNILGLAISLGAFILIVLFVRYELSYDTSHPDHERIYRLTENIDAGSYLEQSSSAPYPAMPAVYNSFPDMIESYVRLYDMQLPVKSIKLDDNRLFNETAVFFADSNFFEFFDFPLLQGEASEVLAKPFTMAISQELARKYYGNENPIGKSVFLGGSDQLRFEITGVYENGGPSHIRPRMVMAMSTVMSFSPFMRQNWVWNPCWSYLKLEPGFSPRDLESQFDGFVKEHYIERLKNMVSHHLQPITDIHLHSHLEFEMSANSDMKYIYIFISAALFLLIVASINYVNLSTVSYFSRTREIGVRKVVGALPAQVRAQILIESVFLTILSYLAGILLLILCFKPFSNRLNLHISYEQLFHWPSLVLLSLFLIAVGLLAGLYPAIRFSRIPVVSVFRSKFSGSKQGQWLRNTLVVIQFSLSIVLIIFTLNAREQLQYLYEKDKGFATDNILLFKITGTQIPQRMKSFKEEMKKDPNVVGVTVMNEILGVNNNNHEFNYEGLPAGEWHYFPALIVDEDFLETFDIPLIAGRDYDPLHTREDSLSMIVNRSMVRFLGVDDPQEAVGKRMQSLSGNEKIIGVTEDFHFKSLHHPVGPMVLDIENRNAFHANYFAKIAVVRVSEVNTSVLEHLEEVWGKFVNHHPFDYRSMSEEIDALYKTEDRMGLLLNLFTVISILVALMGLFALSRFLAYFKTREIAVRKVFGAETGSLLVLASREQFILILMALMLAIPVAWWAVDYWLQSFSYRIEQSWSTYLIAALSTLLLALLTVMLISIRAIRKHPADVLQYE
ncbi:MAG: FtsX-like permease family protein [Owenweeksia sp.]